MPATKTKNSVTLSQSGKEQKLNLTLRELGISEKSNYLKIIPKNLFELFTELVMNSPTDESHLGISWQELAKSVPTKCIDEFSRSLMKALDVKDVFVFNVYEGRCAKHRDIKEQVLHSSKSLICLYIGGDGLLKSLYTSIRNALAHGNIVLKDDYYCLYSVSSSSKQQNMSEYDKSVTFFLRVYSLDKLRAYVDARDSVCRK